LTDAATRFGLLMHTAAANLGDDLQSLAARRFLPRVDVVVPREDLHRDPGGDGPVATILNGWFMHQPRHWPPHPKIAPLLISMHLAAQRRARLRRWLPIFQDFFFADAGLDYLRRHGPVGARDAATQALLEARGVEAWLSGCLTLTLERPAGVQNTGRVVACDLPAPALAALNARLAQPAIATTHEMDPATPAELRLDLAERQLRLYAGAVAVVTTRLHAVLPCLAIGTPVLFVDPGTHPDRLAPAFTFAHSCRLADFPDRADYAFEAPPANPRLHEPLAAALIARCEEFVSARA
jgi:hypothetical protein